jgi:hypothetical protein
MKGRYSRGRFLTLSIPLLSMFEIFTNGGVDVGIWVFWWEWFVELLLQVLGLCQHLTNVLQYESSVRIHRCFTTTFPHYLYQSTASLMITQ